MGDPAPTERPPKDAPARGARRCAHIGAAISGLALALVIASITLYFVGERTREAPKLQVTVNGEPSTTKEALAKAGSALLEKLRGGEDEPADGEASGERVVTEFRYDSKEPAAHRYAKWAIWAGVSLALCGSVFGVIAWARRVRGVWTYLAIWPFFAVIILVQLLSGVAA
ncbi:MAG: hypothetical protein R3B57_00505 [Phycisphaerales bacterium]